MEFDYVIVGGGSAGATLAARLSEDKDASVCLLEAGGKGDGILVRAPAAVVAMLPGRPIKVNNWAFQTVPQPGLNGRKGYQPRGKALGGSSAINAMLYVRGQRQDYDGWADMGCTGWDWDSVLPYFKKAENNERGADDMHGDRGPLHVSNQKEMRPITQAFIRAGEELQHRRREDFNTGDNEGIGAYQVTQFHEPEKNGERCSAAAAYLFPVMSRSNLTVLTKVHAARILFDGKRATGVAYREGKAEKAVTARREVLLCGGAFGSPQLLQLSGVGRADDIRRHGIDMVHELPGVGQNLQDHLDLVLLHTCSAEVLRAGEAVEALLRAKVAGKVRYTGYSGDGEDALQAISMGVFDALQVTFNLVNQVALGDVLPAAERAGMGVIAKRPIANAQLLNMGSLFFREGGHWDPVRKLLAEEGVWEDALELSLRFTLSHDVIHSAIVGTTDADHARANARRSAARPLPLHVVEALHRLGRDS